MGRKFHDEQLSRDGALWLRWMGSHPDIRRSLLGVLNPLCEVVRFNIKK